MLDDVVLVGHNVAFDFNFCKTLWIGADIYRLAEESWIQWIF